MADQGMSKAAKKNMKRKEKKKAEAGKPKQEDKSREPGPQEWLDMLKEQLQIAKETQDHAKAKTLRQQIWVLNDLVRGVRTEIPDEELRPILASIPMFQKKPAEVSEDTSSASNSSGPDPEKRIRALRKKLDQIERLKEMQEKGEKMQENQLKKIASAQEIQEEINIIEDAMSQVSLKR